MRRSKTHSSMQLNYVCTRTSFNIEISFTDLGMELVWEILYRVLSRTLLCVNLRTNLNEDLLPRVWWRFLDHIFAIVKRSQIDDLLKILNGAKYESIKFTCEEESNGKLQFLDLMLTRTLTGSIDVSVFRKPTATSRFITRESFCPNSHKMAAFDSK